MTRLRFALDRLTGPTTVIRGAPVTTGGTLPVSQLLAPVLPALRRGTLVGVEGGPGTSTLALALAAEPLARGSWGAVLGWPDLSPEAAAEVGVPLDRLAIVPEPGRSWWDLASALVDAVDVVVGYLPDRPAAGLARRLTARVRERGAVLVLARPRGVGSHAAPRWPEPLDVVLTSELASWHGLDAGHGVLAGRELEVQVSGRRIPGSGRRARVLLPAACGPLAPLGEVAAEPTEVEPVEYTVG